MFNLLKFFLVIICMIVQGSSSAKDNEMEVYDAENTLIVGTTADFPPFEFITDGNIVGFDIDLINAVAKDLGMEVLIRDMQFYSLIPSLQNGDIQAVVAGMSYTPERGKEIDFSTPYYFNKFAMLVIGEHDKIDPIKPGMKIGVQTGTIMHQWIMKQKIDVEIITMDSNIQLIEDLKSKRLDCVLADDVAAKSVIKASPYLDLNLINLEGVSDAGMSIGLKKDSPLLERINASITKLNENGELAKLKLKWGL